MGSIFFKRHNQLESRQKTLRVLGIALVLLVISTSAVSAAAANLRAVRGIAMQAPVQSQAATQAPFSPVLHIGSSGQMIPDGVGEVCKVITGLAIEKSTNGVDADTKPGVLVSVGDPVTWTYFVSNSGSEVINNLTVTDNNGTPEDPSDDFVVCTINKLTNQATATCTYPGPGDDPVDAVEGPYSNIATVVGTPASGPDVSAQDPSHYLGTIDEPGIYLNKFTNGYDADTAPGPSIDVGEAVTWTYEVYNIGNAELNDVVVVDDQGLTVSCPESTLAVGEYMTCTASGVATAGQYANLGTATGTPASGPDVSDSDPSHYFGVGPAITIEKHTNGQDADTAPGPYILVGESVSWEYLVSNGGSQPISNISVTDDQGLTVSCPQDTLAVGEGMTCTASGTASEGQYTNLGIATGTPESGPEVSDSDESHYFGAQPSISVEKHTNGLDADAAPGPYLPAGESVDWEYIATNNGNVQLTNVSVTDDQGLTVTCPKTTLNVDEQMTCTASGTAAEGQYTNLGTATGTPPGGLSDVSDSDPSHYFGVTNPQPAVDLEKYTYGLDADTAPGPSIPAGLSVTWTYTVTNPGDITLFDLTVTDDFGTPGDDEVCTIASLDPEASETCSASGTAVEGQYTNLGTVTGTYPGASADVTDTDPSNYFGVSEPYQAALALQKVTNGQDADDVPGPFILVGESITWTYNFTNTGDLTLFDLVVMDDNGTPSDPDDDFPVCTVLYLAPDASDSCSNSGTASAGQYTNIATVTGTSPGGLPDVSDSDPSNYFGVQASITLEKLTNDVDADTAPGLSIPVDGAITWTYTVSNTGNVTLSGVVVTDDNGTPGDLSDDQTVCTVSSLNPDESDTCSASGTAVEGQYTNVGTVTGSPPGGLPDVSASDPSNYFGVLEPQPALTLQKSTNGQDADTAPGPSVLVGETVTWSYTVSNPGNVTLLDVVVSDDNGTPGDPSDDFTVCTVASLDPGGSETCSAEGTATEGQYANLGTATGSPTGDLPEVSASDTSHYFGVLSEPEIELQKYTNGFDADSAPGPTLYVGFPVSWFFTVYNPGDQAITDITVSDDNGTPGDDSDDLTVCTLESLPPLASHTCTLQSKVQYGQYANLGTVTGYIDGKVVSATDASHYLGEYPLLYLPLISR